VPQWLSDIPASISIYYYYWQLLSRSSRLLFFLAVVSSPRTMLRRTLILLGGTCLPAFASSTANFRRLPVEDPPFPLPGNLSPLSQSDPRWALLNASGFQYAVKPPGQGGASSARALPTPTQSSRSSQTSNNSSSQISYKIHTSIACMVEMRHRAVGGGFSLTLRRHGHSTRMTTRCVLNSTLASSSSAV